jgi:hypothetical protein
MIILGAVLAVVGAVVGSSILLTLGIVLVLIGLVLNFVPFGAGPRRRYY